MIDHFYYEVHCIYVVTHSLILCSFTHQSAPHVSQACCRVRINEGRLRFAVNYEKSYLVFSASKEFDRCGPTTHWNFSNGLKPPRSMSQEREKSGTTKTTVPSRESSGQHLGQRPAAITGQDLASMERGGSGLLHPRPPSCGHRSLGDKSTTSTPQMIR